MFGNSISTGIIRRPGNSVTLHRPWDSYLYEISFSEFKADRDIVVRYHHFNGFESSWSPHYYRPFHLDRESEMSLRDLVSDPTIACWQIYYNDTCSSPVMAINFRKPNHQKAVAGCYVTKIIPARNNELLILKARYSSILGTASDNSCNVPDCRVCRNSGPLVFNDGAYIDMDYSSYRFVFDTNGVSIDLRLLPILEQAYCGNVVVLLKGETNRICLAVPHIFKDYINDIVCGKSVDFSLYFCTIPIKERGDPLSKFLSSSLRANVWIETQKDSNVFFMRDPLPSILLHKARHLILLEVESHNSYPTDIL